MRPTVFGQGSAMRAHAKDSVRWRRFDGAVDRINLTLPSYASDYFH